MIRSLKVKGLNYYFDNAWEFNKDLNIITGPNGSGKTTLLKLLWYLISGNLERVLHEIPFQSISIETDPFILSMVQVKPDKIELDWKFTGEVSASSTLDIENAERALRELKDRITQTTNRSLFFPDMRRVQTDSSLHRTTCDRDTSIAISTELSTDTHKCIAVVSTEALAELLTQTYADVSEKTDVCHKEAFLNTLSLLSEQSRKILRYRGIHMTEGITLGKAKGAIASHKLSAGEQQMLSFLCYNAFSKDTVIFIDEPELSLHVDWQGFLIPVLLEQAKGNQFFVATHSPFIYALYPDKEILLDGIDTRETSFSDTSAFPKCS